MATISREASRSSSPQHTIGPQERGGDMRETPDLPEAKAHQNGNAKTGQKPAPGSAKDPLRPRRKKARRACFACQRAHLTCGDERPCQRCIKRGLQDACHDGVRKKAKYLHDAPNEALMPGVGANHPYNQANAALPGRRASSSTDTTQQTPNSRVYDSQQRNTYNSYPPNKAVDQQMPPPMLQDGTVDQGQGQFGNQPPTSPSFSLTANSNIQNQNPSTTTPSSATAQTQQNPFGGPFFDPSDPALFNFDLASMNFGNHYGALEFGMLGHLATGAGDTPPSDTATQRGSIGHSGTGAYTTPAPASSNFGESPSAHQQLMFGDPMLNNEWSKGQNSGQGNVNVGKLYDQGVASGHPANPEPPHAFAIETASGNFTSPSSTTSPQISTNIDDTAALPPFPSKQNIPAAPPAQRQPVISTPSLRTQSGYPGQKRRRRNPSSIYENVKEPYPYTSGFHSLTAFIQRRFPPQKTVQIAKALASIRPSFIATTKTLDRDDLIFMEKCFQRTLWEYEDFISVCGTPTIVCRRTGEIAAVGKEFSILTGWKKDVLLGKEPNLNVNTGGSHTGTSSRSSITPRVATESSSSTRTQPVFLAELLDDDSVLEFYEDFAKLAFGDSRGSVMTTCKLLKYKTKENSELVEQQGDAGGEGKGSNALSKGGIAGEAGMNRLGFRDGKVECSYCWTVKRDVFDIPMLIVMNVSLQLDNPKPLP
ncbi:Transcriptional regulator of nonfermentable carbon utilization [Arachnomyces sp. PD_36]|nr:Transcriptional regulator of nonfermentable carbon utilization [Arachnomyces sp. PD_36]